MPHLLLEILKHYHIFGLLNLFLLYILLLSYSDKKLTLWYSTFVLSIVLDLFNYVGLFNLFFYSPNFTLAYLPWSAFTPIALYKLTLISYNIKEPFHKRVFQLLFLSFCVMFCYFFIKSYYILLGDLTLRNRYFITENTFALIEYWIIKIFIATTQFIGLALSYSIIKKSPIKLNKDVYYLFIILSIITFLSVIQIVQDLYGHPNNILSSPNNLYLTIITTGGLIIAYRKIIGIDASKRKNSQTTTNNKSYELDFERLKNIEEKIRSAMEEKQLYKNRKLQLKDLSKEVSTPENYVSEVLSKQLQTNYYDFINSYRVHEVKRLMHSEKYKDYKLMALATEAGFNSKTTFNAAFKKSTGQTPSEYKKGIFPKKNMYG
ncbi:helix-turn-helix domain-containing protein [Flavivirga algicola]|uniref:Helix-turn-helix transcriptional regulator n=1 Tax=Flavivirga algicola TaxID=2729136 RepID=A0ABX1RZP3_9FLAO|nr:helix-turn-helix domain-containing protein [Flavivirga algicola]NMH87664.1 helix-turn-helix transcriptional regulator [Flavivirga algicola]